MIVTIGETIYTIKIMPDYAPEADLAIKWSMATNGKHLKCDRGTTADVHRCAVRVMGDKTAIQAVWSAITESGTDRVTSATIEAGEYLFGPSTVIDGTPVEIVWESVSELTQRTLGTMGFSATVALNGAMSYDVAAPTLPITYRPDASATIIGENYFRAAPFYGVSTSGFDAIQATAHDAQYKFSCVMQREDAAALQTWYESVNRGAVLTNVAGADVVLSGVSNPFGNNYSWPCACVFTEMYFAPMGPQYWRINATLARAK